MSDTKAAEALTYNNSWFHLSVHLVSFGRGFFFGCLGVCGYKRNKKYQHLRGQHNSLSYHGLGF